MSTQPSRKPRSPRWTALILSNGAAIAVGVSLIVLSDWMLTTFGRVATSGEVTGRPFVLHAAVLGVGQALILAALVVGAFTALVAYRYVSVRRASGDEDWVFPVMRVSQRANSSAPRRADDETVGTLPHYMVCQMSRSQLTLWGDKGPVVSLRWTEISEVQVDIGPDGPRQKKVTVVMKDGSGQVQVSVLSTRWLLTFERDDDVLREIQHFAHEHIRPSSVSEH